ncbi:hypothetical protein BAE44_0020427, partial [Dichanthelium oligosanthes]
LEDDQFQNEVTYLIGLRQKNIVQLVGYCAESRWEATRLNLVGSSGTLQTLVCPDSLINNNLGLSLKVAGAHLDTWHQNTLANGLISAKADIFSLAVIIIELMTGSRDYPPWGSEASSRHFIETAR